MTQLDSSRKKIKIKRRKSLKNKTKIPQKYSRRVMEINYLSTRAVDEAGEDNRDVDWQPCRSTVKQQ